MTLQRRAMIAVCWFFLPSLAGAQEQTAFRYVQDVAMLDATGPQVVAVALDEPAWTVLDVQAADLRVFDSEGVSVPYLLRRATVQRLHSVPKPVRVRVADLQTLESNAVQVVLDVVDDEPSADRLTLETPLKNFERRVTVQGQCIDESWETLVEDALIYDYTRFMDVRRIAIDLPANQARRLRVIVADVTDDQRSALTRMTQRHASSGDSVEEAYDVQRRPLRIDRITAATLQQVEQARIVQTRPYSIQSFVTRQDDKARETLIEVGLQGVPAQHLELRVADDNFVRQASIEVPVRGPTRPEWRPIASGRLHRVRLGGQNQESLMLAFAEQRVDRLRVRLRHHDNPPLTVEGVEIIGPQYEVVFIAEPGRDYGLYYGAPGQRVPVYDTAALLTAAATIPLPLAVGPRRENPLWCVAAPSRWRWLQSRGFFLMAIAAAVAALAVGVMRAVRRAGA